MVELGLRQHFLLQILILLVSDDMHLIARKIKQSSDEKQHIASIG